MYKALEVAKYIITKCTKEDHPISNLQLQKILYYVQKEFLQQDREAFSDEFEAWQFGPVVPEVYRQYCGFGAMPIRLIYDQKLTSEYEDIIDPIVETKRELNPWDMVTETHQKGKAWDLTFQQGAGSYHVIAKSLIKTKG